MEFDVGLHSNLHAGLRAHRRRDELVAGDRYDFPGQPYRASSDGAKRSRRNALWNSFPGLRL